MSRFIAAASASALLLLALPLAPASAQEIGTMRVTVGDLRLGSHPGANLALNRIRTAARGFCGDEATVRQLGQKAQIGNCVRRMTYLAVNKLDAPMVTALYDQSGSTPPILLAHR